jgi:hypothetical protein
MGNGVKRRVFDMLEMIFTIAKIAGIENAPRRRFSILDSLAILPFLAID